MAKRRTPQRRRQGKKARTAAQYFAQTKRRQTTLKKTAHVVTEMRTGNVSLRQASIAHAIAPTTVLRHAKSALRKTARGTYAARGRDRLLRVVVVPTPDGLAEIATRDSGASTIAAEYWNAVHLFLDTGDDRDLVRFRDATIMDAEGNPVRLLTNLDELERLGSAGVLSFQSLYARAG